MSTAAHTEGPWSVENVEYGDEITSDLCILGPSPSFRAIASVSRCFQGERIQTMEVANARLIAAAPCLLVALQDLLSITPGADCEDFHHAPKDRHSADESCPVWNRYAKALIDARAAIARATGEQP